MDRVIYGGTGGIEAATAQALGARGYGLHLVGRDAGRLERLAAELARRVRVNMVAPSLTRTPPAEAITRNAAQTAGIAGMHALQRPGEPEDAAALAGFLVSREASYVTGQTIGVDGGRARLRTKG